MTEQVPWRGNNVCNTDFGVG